MSPKRSKSQQKSNPEIPTYEVFMRDLKKASSFKTNAPFNLLSTIRYDPLLSSVVPQTVQEVTKKNFFLLQEHLERLKFTINFFDSIDGSFSSGDSLYVINEADLLDKLKTALDEAKVPLDKPLKIRLLVSKEGEAKIELYETPERPNLLDGLSDEFPIESRYDVFVDRTPVLASPFTSFKTTYRDIYTAARKKALPGLSAREEVVLVNTTSEVMEGSITSIAIKSKEGVWITPKLTSGCLCGVMRHFLLKKNMIREGDISIDMLKQGHDVMLMNGIMGCVRGTIKGFV